MRSGPGHAGSSDNPYDLVLLDIEMPGLNGFDFCKQLRKVCPATSAPVVRHQSLGFEHRAKGILSGGRLIAKPSSQWNWLSKPSCCYCSSRLPKATAR
jgi:DNA-binding response OmpR family regulator